jgi:hypothetical protein
VRQDHIAINRKVDESERVIGTNLAGVKIGGDINKSLCSFPNPMGATGSTIDTAMDVYSKHGTKTVFRTASDCNSEYLRHLVPQPNLHIFALRLTRIKYPRRATNRTEFIGTGKRASMPSITSSLALVALEK